MLQYEELENWKSRSKDRSWVEKSRMYLAFEENDEGKETEGKELLDNIKESGLRGKSLNYSIKLPKTKKRVSNKNVHYLVIWGYDLIF